MNLRRGQKFERLQPPKPAHAAKGLIEARQGHPLLSVGPSDAIYRLIETILQQYLSKTGRKARTLSKNLLKKPYSGLVRVPTRPTERVVASELNDSRSMFAGHTTRSTHRLNKIRLTDFPSLGHCTSWMSAFSRLVPAWRWSDRLSEDEGAP